MEEETRDAPDTSAVPDADLVVQQTLESMLSKKHLVKDPNLAGHMNPQMFIPIAVLLAHARLQAVNATQEMVIAAATRSARLGIDDTHQMVRPLLKAKRNIVILREMPTDTSEAEIRQIFASSQWADLIREVRPEVNSTWFVKLHLDDASEVVMWLRTQDVRGKPVDAAMKSEHFLKEGPATSAPLGPMPPMPPNADFQYAVPEGMQQTMPQQMQQQPMQQVSPDFGGQGLGPQMWQQPTQMDFGGQPSWADVPQVTHPGHGFGLGPDGNLGGPMQMQQFQGMPPGPAMPMPQFDPSMGLQPPGYWQPWGARLQPAPLIFISSTALSPASMAAVAEQAGDPSSYRLDDDMAEPDRSQGGGGKGSSNWDNSGGGGGWDRGGGWEKSSGWKNDDNWGSSRWDSGGWGGGGGWERDNSSSNKGQGKSSSKGKGDGDKGGGKGNKWSSRR